MYIVGRSKDVIKKSGITLSPAIIESAIKSKYPVKAVAFGVPHPVFGEVPCAVLKWFGEKKSTDEVMKAVEGALGPEYALGQVLELQELGMQEFEMTSTSKITKVPLREAVARLKQQ